MLAIIIPYYNFTFFEETLLSLANQTDNRFKVYIGNDASPEDPSLILEKYKGQFDFVYHRFENNLGGISLTQQWERCITLSGNEEWIMILGDDDVLGDNVVSEFYRNFIDFFSRSNVVRFATKIVNEKSGEISDFFLHPKYESAQDSWFRKFKGNSRGSLSENIFSRSAYAKYGFTDYPLAWHSDDRAWLDFSNNKLIYTINNSIVYVRVSDNSISGRNDNENLKKKSTLQFFKNSIVPNLYLYTKQQRLELLYGFEVIIKKKRKVTISEWLTMGKLYFINFSFIIIVKFIRRIFISLFNL